MSQSKENKRVRIVEGEGVVIGVVHKVNSVTKVNKNRENRRAIESYFRYAVLYK